MNTTQKPDAHQSHERKPTTPQHDDSKQHPGQSGPANPGRQDHRDTDHKVPHKK